ncbi:RICIN domain-containing protein [Streptomyces sp. NPDC048290]|uniref:RICIN domain-containing protein n=1 Tax=Streptomyces sp. NPDC048290 TaxID=3155811 RepID=UPI003430F221
MLDAGSSNSPDPVPHPVGELLDRNWEAAFAYARLCTDGSRAAGTLTTAAFTRLLGQLPPHGGPSPIWRQRLLVTVRRIAAEWSTDDRRAALAPELRGELPGHTPGHTPGHLPGQPRGAAHADGPRRPSATLVPVAERRLVAAAFQRLPESARCLLWHSQVESDPLSVPAALLGTDVEHAAVELRRARERLRAESVQVHHELAPSQRCRHFSRMLDVTCRRRGAEIDPDLGVHLDACPHCWHTADQLCRFDTDLGVVLAEAVLGWGARRYTAARAARVTPEALARDIPPRPVDAPLSAVPSPRRAPAPESLAAVPSAALAPRPPAPRVAARRAAARRRNRAAAIFTVSALVALPFGLWAAGGSGEGAPVTAGTPDSEPAGTASDPTAPSDFDTASAPGRDVHGRLHNAASGLCLTVAGDEVAKDAVTELAPCGDDPGQRWSYETDGLLRSAADPGLCVDSRIGHSVRLAACEDTADVRYDLSLKGALVPRWDQDLALTPAATDGTGALTVKMRDGSPAQRWVFDTSQPDLRMAAHDRDEIDAPARATPTAPTPAATTSRPAPAPTPPPAASTAPAPRPSTEQPCRPYSCDGDDRWDDGDRDRDDDRGDGRGHGGWGDGRGHGGGRGGR